MLDFIRSHKRLMMILLALFIVPGLGLVGIQGFRGMFDESANAAKVGGDPITRQQFDAAVRNQIANARQSLGQSFDQASYDTPAMRRATLDGLIQQRLTMLETRRLNLTASDSAVRTAIMAIPAIAGLKRPDGSFDTQAYEQLLASQGLTGQQIDESTRFQIASQQIPQNIGQSAFLSKTSATQLISLIGQQRDVQGMVLRASDYRSQVNPSEADIKQYYDTHHADFTTQESANIQYVILSASALAAAYTPSDAEITQYYDTHISQYRTDAQVRASHILITVAKDASAADQAQAKTKAEGILAQVKAHPDQFEALAKQDSQDPGSAAKGGDLGWFGHGMMLKSFEDAAFGLKKGEISGLVRTDFGYHIIEVTDTKPSVTQPLTTVRDAIVQALKTQNGTQKYAADVDGFSNSVYEQGDSLKPAADKFGLSVQTATLTRTPNPARAATDPTNSPKVLAAVFSDDVLKNKHNSAAIDLGNSTQISARVVDYKPATLPPLEQVREAVRNKLVESQSRALAQKDGESKLAAFEKTPASADAGFSAVAKVSRSNPQGVPAVAMSAIFKAAPNKLPAFVGAALPDGGYAIYRINQVEPGAPPDADHLGAIEAQIAQVEGQSEVTAYNTALRNRSSVKVYDLSGSVDDAGNAGQ